MTETTIIGPNGLMPTVHENSAAAPFPGEPTPEGLCIRLSTGRIDFYGAPVRALLAQYPAFTGDCIRISLSDDGRITLIDTSDTVIAQVWEAAATV